MAGRPFGPGWATYVQWIALVWQGRVAEVIDLVCGQEAGSGAGRSRGGGDHGSHRSVKFGRPGPIPGPAEPGGHGRNAHSVSGSPHRRPVGPGTPPPAAGPPGNRPTLRN